MGRGPSSSRLALIGQGPGKTEAAMDEPFIGYSGMRLDKWLARARINRANVWVDNIVRCQMPNDRPPNRKELTHCLETHVLPGLRTLGSLRVVVPIGSPAAKALLLRLSPSKSSTTGSAKTRSAGLGDSVGAQIPVSRQQLLSTSTGPTSPRPTGETTQEGTPNQQEGSTLQVSTYDDQK